MANKNLSISADGIAKLKKYEAEIDGIYEDQSGYCTAGVGHLINKQDKWGCFLLTAASADNDWKSSIAKRFPGSDSEVLYLRRTAAFATKFADLKTKAVELAKVDVGQKRYGKAFDKLTKAEQDKVTMAAQAAVDEQGKVLAQTPDELLKQDLSTYENAVRNNVTTPLTQVEYDVLVSLCWNIGPGAFANSSVVTEINRGKYKSGEAKDRSTAINAIEQAFARYNRSAGVVVEALTKRRKDESDRYLQEARALLADLQKKAPSAGAPAAAGGPKPVAVPAAVKAP